MGTALAQSGPMRDGLAGLRQLLSEAGAPALTAAQEQQLNALIAARRATLRAEARNAAQQAAQRAYQTAILNGDNAAAQAQADIIATEMANSSRNNLKDSAKFQIDVLNVLKSNDNQLGLLQNRIGSVGLARLLGSLAGGFRGPGPGGPRGMFERRIPPMRGEMQR